MKKSNNRGSVDKSSTTKEKTNCLNQQVEQQNVQQRYHSEFLKYQEQIDKIKQMAQNDQAA